MRMPASGACVDRPQRAPSNDAIDQNEQKPIVAGDDGQVDTRVAALSVTPRRAASSCPDARVVACAASRVGIR